MAFALAKNCTKVGLAGGAVYWSVQQGVWGTPDEGYDAMKKFSEAIVPSQELVKKEPLKVRSSKRSSMMGISLEGDIVSNAWNKGTTVVFQSLITAPQTVGNYAHVAGDTVTKLVNENIPGK